MTDAPYPNRLAELFTTIRADRVCVFRKTDPPFFSPQEIEVLKPHEFLSAWTLIDSPIAPYDTHVGSTFIVTEETASKLRDALHSLAMVYENVW